MANNNVLFNIVRTVEGVILDRPDVDPLAFLDIWDVTSPTQRQTIFRLYGSALQGCYYDRGSAGQTIIRAVLSL